MTLEIKMNDGREPPAAMQELMQELAGSISVMVIATTAKLEDWIYIETMGEARILDYEVGTARISPNSEIFYLQKGKSMVGSSVFKVRSFIEEGCLRMVSTVCGKQTKEFKKIKEVLERHR